MATTTLPQRRTGISRGRWIWIGIGATVIAIVVALLLTRTINNASTPTVATTTVTSGSIVASVDGSGTVTAAQSVDLTFQTSGSVAHVLVKAGDVVHANQTLAQLDPRDLELQVASAQAALESAQTRLTQTKDGNVQPADITAQQ